MEKPDISDLMLIHNAKIWRSGEEDYNWMTFSPSTGYIHRLGRSSEFESVEGIPQGSRIDYGGRRILPGLHESHIHVLNIGKRMRAVDLRGCKSPEDLIERVKNHAAVHKDEKWIIGAGWEQDLLGRYPTKADLDQACQDRPIYLSRVCNHVAVVNSVGLSLAKITKDTKDPVGGTIVRNPADGEPNGLLEENACNIAKLVIEPLTSGAKIELIKEAIQLLLRNGVTSAHACEEGTWNEFCQLADANELPIRIFFSAFYRPPTPGNFPKAGEGRGKLLSCDRIKLFTDGALGPTTAAISLPYRGTCNHGTLLQTQDTLTQDVEDVTSQGYRLEVHAIGDAAAEALLNALEKVPVAKEKRPILTHCQILRKDLIERMHNLGVVANIQPQFVPTDARWIMDILPPELLQYSYAWKTLLDRGIPCAGGSDAPVETPTPLIGIYDCIYRQYDGRDPSNQKIFRPEECLSLTESVDLYTKGGAYATMKEGELGQLLPGFQADFIVLDRDIVDNPRELLNAKVDEAWVAGVRRL